MYMGQKFQCPECEFNATTKGDVASHQKSVHMGPKFQCPECEYNASTKGSLVAHQKSVHMGQKFQCLECDYKVTQKSVLATHKKSLHMGTKNSMSKVYLWDKILIYSGQTYKKRAQSLIVYHVTTRVTGNHMINKTNHNLVLWKFRKIIEN